MSKINKIPDFIGMAEELKSNMFDDAEKMGLDFIQTNFEKEGFMNGSFEAWAGRKTASSYKLLTVTGTLRNSIRADRNDTQVIFTADTPYAQIHNEGGIIKMKRTKKMRGFFWFMFKATGIAKYKWMAISKKPNVVFRIPKRQFMGDSKNFTERWDRHIVREILTNFKNIKHK